VISLHQSITALSVVAQLVGMLGDIPTAQSPKLVGRMLLVVAVTARIQKYLQPLAEKRAVSHSRSPRNHNADELLKNPRCSREKIWKLTDAAGGAYEITQPIVALLIRRGCCLRDTPICHCGQFC
jgi:hypothetical protein